MLKIKVKALFEANGGEYGYRRLHRALLRGGERCSPELVRRLEDAAWTIAYVDAGLRTVNGEPFRGRFPPHGESPAPPPDRSPATTAPSR